MSRLRISVKGDSKKMLISYGFEQYLVYSEQPLFSKKPTFEEFNNLIKLFDGNSKHKN